MRTLRSLLLILLLCFPPIYASAGSSQLDLQQNGMFVTTDGEDSFFFLPDNEGNWTIQSASNHFLKKSALYMLPEGEVPFAMLYADAKTLWFASYNKVLRYEDEDATWSAANIFRVNKENATMEAILTDADAQGIYPTDGSGIYYVPWNNPGMLCKIDFLTAHDQTILSLENETIWSVTQSTAGLFTLAIDQSGKESLHRVTENEVETLSLPNIAATEYWLQGNYCLAKNENNSALFCISLEDTKKVVSLPEALRGTSLYRYGNTLLGVEENKEGLADVYYVNLENNKIIKSAYYDAPPYYFVLGLGGQKVCLLDGMGRILQIADGFETLQQVAQVNMALLYDEGVWVYALPFDDYILLLGYRHEDSFRHPGDKEPPTLAKVIPIGTGMHQDEAENAIGNAPLPFPKTVTIAAL